MVDRDFAKVGTRVRSPLIAPMKTIISNNYLHSPPSRTSPLISVGEDEVVMDNLFITDVSYAKFLIPVIKAIDSLKKNKLYKLYKWYDDKRVHIKNSKLL